MISPILCLSLLAVSAWASVELHGILELPRSIWSLTESRRFKRQSGLDSATKCIISCAQDFGNVMKPLGMDKPSPGFLNSRMFDPNTFNSFCEGMYQWDSCSGVCPNSQIKHHLVKAFKLFESLCGEDKETFVSHQTCYRESDPQQNEVCDPLCGGQEKIQELMKEVRSVAGDWDAISRILNETCELTSCQMDCRIPIIYSACKDKEAAFFIGRWAQKTMKQALGLIARFDLNIQCDDVINFNPKKFDFNEEPPTNLEVEGRKEEEGKRENGSKEEKDKQQQKKQD